jgi:hypothetical protein
MKGEAMSIYESVMQARGFRRDAEPQAQPLGRAVTIAHRSGQQVAVPMPNPDSADYVRERERFDNWRGTVSPRGGAMGGPWGYKPKFGDAALKPEYRRKAWGGSVPWQTVPKDMSGFQWKRK